MTTPMRTVPIAQDFGGKSFKSALVPLYLLFRANLELGRGLIIEDCVFEDCNIEGPALVVPLRGVRFDRCDMGNADGDPGNLILKPVGPKVTGAIVLSNCVFTGCRFVNVGFTGDEQFLSLMMSI